METLPIDSRVLQICRNPIFVIGSPRSGTTISAVALSQHPDFWVSDETFFMHALFGVDGRVEREIDRLTSRAGGSWLRREKVSREEFLSYLGVGLNALITSRSEGKRWIDHTPIHALMAEVLTSMFPGAFFIHILRDGRRVVHSMVHLFDKLPEEKRENMRARGQLPNWSTNFRNACATWRKMTGSALDFCQKYPERGLTVRLEELERDPVEGFGGVLKFLQAEPLDAPSNYFESHRINSSFSKTVTVGDLVPDRVSEPWETWTAEQKEIFAEVAGNALASYGFVRTEEELFQSYA